MELGQIVSCKEYDIEDAIVVGIREYNKEYGDSVNGTDITVKYMSNGYWTEDTLLEYHFD